MGFKKRCLKKGEVNILIRTIIIPPSFTDVLVACQMELLNRRTQLAIVDLIKERIELEGEEAEEDDDDDDGED